MMGKDNGALCCFAAALFLFAMCAWAIGIAVTVVKMQHANGSEDRAELTVDVFTIVAASLFGLGGLLCLVQGFMSLRKK